MDLKVLTQRIYRGAYTPEEAVRTPYPTPPGRKPKDPSEPLVPDLDEPWEESDWSWYIVACHPDGLTLKEIGEVFGLTRERIRQIEAKAIRKLTAIPSRKRLLQELLVQSIEQESRRAAAHAHITDGAKGQWVTQGRHDALRKGKEMAGPTGRKITVGKHSLTIKEWAKKTKISDSAIYMRIGNGWTEAEAVSTPKGQRPERLSGKGAKSRQAKGRGRVPRARSKPKEEAPEGSRPSAKKGHWWCDEHELDYPKGGPCPKCEIARKMGDERFDGLFESGSQSLTGGGSGPPTSSPSGAAPPTGDEDAPESPEDDGPTVRGLARTAHDAGMKMSVDFAPAPPVIPSQLAHQATRSGALVIYHYPLRPGVFIEAHLPQDLTRKDVDRIYRWLDTLVLEDDDELKAAE